MSHEPSSPAKTFPGEVRLARARAAAPRETRPVLALILAVIVATLIAIAIVTIAFVIVRPGVVRAPDNAAWQAAAARPQALPARLSA